MDRTIKIHINHVIVTSDASATARARAAPPNQAASPGPGRTEAGRAALHAHDMIEVSRTPTMRAFTAGERTYVMPDAPRTIRQCRSCGQTDPATNEQRVQQAVQSVADIMEDICGGVRELFGGSDKKAQTGR